MMFAIDILKDRKSNLYSDLQDAKKRCENQKYQLSAMDTRVRELQVEYDDITMAINLLQKEASRAEIAANHDA